MSDEELLAGLDPSFYGQGFEPLQHIFGTLGSHLDEQTLSKEIENKERLQQLIDSSLSDRVIKNYSAFGEPFPHHLVYNRNGVAAVVVECMTQWY